MTTLQTLSSRSTHSAETSAIRAQSNDIRADDAQGFAGVLDAFTAEPAEPLIEDAGDQDPSERTEPEETDKDPKSKESTSEEPSSDPVEVDEPVTSTEPIEEPVQGHPDQRPVEHSQPIENTPVNTQPQPQTHAIHSAGDLGVLLTNAASINLAALATQQLEGSASAQSTGTVNADASIDGSQRKQPNPVTHTPPSSNGTGSKPHGAGVDFPFPGSTTPSWHGRNGATVGTTDAALIKSAQQSNTPEVAPTSTQHLTQQTQVQAAQSVQAATPDISNNARRLNGVRSIAEIAGVSSKATPTASNTTNAQTGSDQGAMDLGSQSKAATKLSSTQSDDRAMQRQQVMTQVQRGLASIMNTKGGSMKLRLTPEHLGEVNIQLSTKDGMVTVQIDAKNDATRSMLESGLDDLRHAMESRGATVNELRVESPEPSAFERMFGQTTQNHDHNRSRSDQNQNESNQNTPDEQHESESDDHSTPQQARGIWTDIGLDAIA